MMLRECVRHEPLAKIILYAEEFYSFFNFVELSTFDIASDAFSTFKVCPGMVNGREVQGMPWHGVGEGGSGYDPGMV